MGEDVDFRDVEEFGQGSGIFLGQILLCLSDVERDDGFERLADNLLGAEGFEFREDFRALLKQVFPIGDQLSAFSGRCEGFGSGEELQVNAACGVG